MATERSDVDWSDVLAFWFGDDWRAGDRATGGGNDRWFVGGPAVDAEVTERFAGALALARAGALDDWTATAPSYLALIVTLDQLSRNIYRDRPEAYAGDAKTQQLVVAGLDRPGGGVDRELWIAGRWFFYMPLMHAEDRALQQRSIACFERLLADAPDAQRPMAEGALAFARGHAETVSRFGRFPHRNAILGRPSTPEEEAYLARRSSR